MCFLIFTNCANDTYSHCEDGRYTCQYYPVWYGAKIGHYTTRFNEVERGLYWFHGVRTSVRRSVRLCVCGQNIFLSVSSTIPVGSISYLHILPSNFRRCVACNVCFQIYNFENNTDVRKHPYRELNTNNSHSVACHWRIS